MERGSERRDCEEEWGFFHGFNGWKEKKKKERKKSERRELSGCFPGLVQENITKMPLTLEIRSEYRA